MANEHRDCMILHGLAACHDGARANNTLTAFVCVFSMSSGQKRLTNIAVCRLKKAGHR